MGRPGEISRCLWAACWAALLACGCTGPASPSIPGGGAAAKNGLQKPQIVATTAMVGDMVQAVAGDRFDVVSLMGSGVDPHLFKPTRDDVIKLNRADAVVYSGLHLEGRMTEAFERLRQTGKPVFAVTDKLPRQKLRRTADSGDHFDPHVWMDVALWSECVPSVAVELSRLDPAHAAEFQERATAYRAQLDQLDRYASETLGSIPAKQRVIVTAHDAFGYFSLRYKIEVRAPQGVSTEAEASAKDVSDLVEFVVSRKLPGIFVESSLSGRYIAAIIEGAQARGWTVQECGPLYSDAMGPPGAYEGTYLGMIDHNVTAIARGLGGAPPDGGYAGKLSSLRE